MKDTTTGYCVTCKRSLDSVRLCNTCAHARKTSSIINDVKIKPPQVRKLYKEEK